jgi:hypothetical protein
MSTIPVICDRCRSIGNSGEGDFSHLGDLLEFEPVPRRQRVNGWDAEAQRAFIAALAMCGSKTRAAKSLGRNAFGIEQLLKSKGSESFRLAYDRAMAIAAKNGSMRIATGVADAAARNSWLDKRSALRGHEPPPDPEPEIDDEQKWALIEQLGAKFLRKVAAERDARLAGRIVEADFHLRQITFLEVMFDLTAETLGWDAGEVLGELRRGSHSLLEIASTPLSDWLDESRRNFWQSEGDPPRPEHPDKRFLVEHEGCTTQAAQNAYGATTTPARGYSAEQWAAMGFEQQQRARERQFAEDAEEQVEWEAKARRDFESRRDSAT